MKKILILALFLSLSLFIPSCEKEDSITTNQVVTAPEEQPLNNGINGKLIASAKPAKGYEVNFYEIEEGVMAIQSTYPKDATGELVDLIEVKSGKISSVELYKRLVGNSINASQLSALEIIQTKSDKAVAEYEAKLQRGEISLPSDTELAEAIEHESLQNGRTEVIMAPPLPCTREADVRAANRVCPDRSGQYARFKCSTNVTGFTSTHRVVRDYILRAQPLPEDGTGVRIKAVRTICQLACPNPGCPPICFALPTPDVNTTLSSGSSVFQVIIRVTPSPGSTVTMKTDGSGLGPCNLFHMGTAADRNPPL